VKEQMQTIEQLKQEWHTVHNNINWSNKSARKEAKKRLKQIEQQATRLLPLNVGDIFYESWGYDQTNIDFCKVIEISPTRKTVICQMVNKTVERQEFTADYVQPDKDFGIKFRLHVRAWLGSSGEITLRGKYPFCQGSYPSCKLIDNRTGSVLNCSGNISEEETERYYLWSGGKKRVWCKDCPNFYEKPHVSYRDGSFMKHNGKAHYETALGFGH